MKKQTGVLFCWIVLFGWGILFGNGTIEKNRYEVSSKIIDVIVYPKWAYVTRLAVISVDRGTNRYSIKNLPSWIDQDSLRVKIKSSIPCTILGTLMESVGPSQRDKNKIKIAQKKVTEWKDKIEDLESELAILDREKKYLSDLSVWKLQKIPHESAAREVKIHELKSTKNFLVQEMINNVSKTNTLKRKIRDLKPERDARIKELKNLKRKINLKKKEITVEIHGRERGEARLFLSYLISGASWYPTYDARTDTTKENIVISCKATVQQTTGEDWKNATFTLSTVQPYLLRERPVLQPLVIDKPTPLVARQRFRTNQKRKQLEEIENKQQSFFYGAKEKSSFQGLLDNIRQAKQIIREVEGRGTTIELKIDGKYSIKSDGKPVKLEVGEAKLKSHPSFISVPSVSKSTYITSNIKNEASFPLLPGTLKIYIDGNFIGKSKIGFIAEGEEFEIYLGFEERIKVTRELNFKLSSGTFSAKKKRLKIAYTIRVKNYLNSRARIEVHDQIPISQKKEIKIRLLDHDPTAKTDNKGILKWSVQLEPGGEQTIKYAYQMDYPGDLNIQNMEQLEKRIKIKRVNEK